jgi:hypothetical protein
MNKEINLVIHLTITGSDLPAHDFAAEAAGLVRRAITAGAKAVAAVQEVRGLPARVISVVSVEAVEGEFEE